MLLLHVPVTRVVTANSTTVHPRPVPVLTEEQYRYFGVRALASIGNNRWALPKTPQGIVPPAGDRADVDEGVFTVTLSKFGPTYTLGLNVSEMVQVGRVGGACWLYFPLLSLPRVSSGDACAEVFA